MSKKIAIIFESKEQLEKYSMYSKRKLINKIGMDFPYIRYIENSNIFNCSVGASCSMIASIIEEISSDNYDYAIRIGTCGALKDFIRINDIVLSLTAIKGEGVSQYYIPNEYPAYSSLDLNTIKNIFCEISNVHIGNVYSCSARYRQNSKLIDKYKNLGTLAIDMETSAFYSVCIAKGIKSVSVLFVTDSISDEEVSGCVNSLDLYLKTYSNMFKSIELLKEYIFSE